MGWGEVASRAEGVAVRKEVDRKGEGRATKDENDREKTSRGQERVQN